LDQSIKSSLSDRRPETGVAGANGGEEDIERGGKHVLLHGPTALTSFTDTLVPFLDTLVYLLDTFIGFLDTPSCCIDTPFSLIDTLASFLMSSSHQL
jgi:hypothetical protein